MVACSARYMASPWWLPPASPWWLPPLGTCWSPPAALCTCWPLHMLTEDDSGGGSQRVKTCWLRPLHTLAASAHANPPVFTCWPPPAALHTLASSTVVILLNTCRLLPLRMRAASALRSTHAPSSATHAGFFRSRVPTYAGFFRSPCRLRSQQTLARPSLARP